MAENRYMEKHNKTEKLNNSNVSKSKSLLFFGYWLPVLLWMTTIFVLSSQHSVRVAPDYWLNFAFFKMLHVIEYMTFFALSYRATSASLPTRKSLWGIIAFVITVAYAASDEIHQMFTPTREPTLRDVIIDTIGAGLIWYYLSALLPKAPKRLKKLARSLGIPY
jgi:VanZ family protein